MGSVFIEWILSERVFLVREGLCKMPGDMVSFAVSTGIGISVVAGILSGMCYVFTYSTQRKSNKRTANKNIYCGVCGEYFRSIDHILEGESTVKCIKCQSKVCQNRCAKEKKDGWICKNCLRPPESWLQGVLYTFKPNNQGQMEDQTDPNKEKVVDENNSIKTRQQVQEFIEKLVNSMLGQDVDDANVTKLYNDENYNSFFAKYHQDLSKSLTDLGSSLHNSIVHLPLTGQQSPCTAHAVLKQIIEKVVQEVQNLPQLQKHEDGRTLPPDLNNKTYEDLLATAILNKAISSSQNGRPSSSAASVSSSRLSSSSHIKEEKEYFFGEETLDNKWKHTDLETTSVSSLEDWIQSDSSFGSRKYVDRVTLTIKQDIEEVSQLSDSDENDDQDNDSVYFNTKSSIWSDDEPNWFLQKRQFHGTHSPVPVPMLVPNPITEAKVLIGDKELNETSDLSDVESEFGETEIIPTRQSLLVNSKTVIGGKNIIHNGLVEAESESESSGDSGVKEVDREQSAYDDSEFGDSTDKITESTWEVKDVGDASSFQAKADITVDDDNVEDVSLLSVYSNTEQEAEYTEQYASLPRQIEKKPQPSARQSLQNNKIDNENEKEKGTKETDGDKDSEEEIKIIHKHFSGTYSVREKEKWKNAIEMKNNPYSKENIERRIQRSNSGLSSLFGPDYYAKLASSPSGTKARSATSPEVKEFSWPLHKEDSKENNNKEDKEKYVSKTYIASEDKDIHRAIPILIEKDYNSITNGTSTKTEGFNENMRQLLKDEQDSGNKSLNYNISTHPINQKSMEEQQNGDKSPDLLIAEVTSDSDLSYVNYYDVENSQVYKTTTTTESERNTPTFTKNIKSTTGQKTWKKLERTPSNLRRHKSESDLIDVFDAPPKVVAKKKDNTLISKIYKSLSKSDLTQSRTDFNEPPAFRKQLSSPQYIQGNINRSYNSDDDKNRERNNLSRNGSQENFNSIMSITKKLSLSSEDDHSDKSSFYSEYKPIRNPYGSSSEDLLSIEDTDRTKKRDNTLISMIYKQANVRNYVLSKRETAPVDDVNYKSVKKGTSDDEVFEEKSRINKVSEVQSEEIKRQLEEVLVNYDKNEIPPTNEKPIIRSRRPSETEMDVQEIAKKKIVHNILDKMSNSNSQSDYWENREYIGGGLITTSVRDLRKKFENNLGKSQVVSSLTARSLSRHLRKTLRN